MEKIPTIDNNKNNFFKLKLEKLKNIPKDMRKFFLIMVAVSASLTASAQESSSIDQDQNSEKTEIYTEMEKEFNIQRDFLINWFNKRIIKNENLNNEFNKEKNEILRRLEKVILSETRTSSEWRNDTIFVNAQDFSDEKNKTIITHELSHDAFPANYGRQHVETLVQTMPDWMIEIIKQSLEISGDEGLKEVSLFKKYYQRPEEVYARICALRQKYNMDPTQIVSEDFLNEIIKENNEKKNDSNIESLLMTITDKEQLLKLLNNLP